MGLSENCVPHCTQWLMIIIPTKWLFFWGVYPIFRHTQMAILWHVMILTPLDPGTACPVLWFFWRLVISLAFHCRCAAKRGTKGTASQCERTVALEGKTKKTRSTVGEPLTWTCRSLFKRVKDDWVLKLDEEVNPIININKPSSIELCYIGCTTFILSMTPRCLA